MIKKDSLVIQKFILILIDISLSRITGDDSCSFTSCCLSCTYSNIHTFLCSAGFVTAASFENYDTNYTNSYDRFCFILALIQFSKLRFSVQILWWKEQNGATQLFLKCALKKNPTDRHTALTCCILPYKVIMATVGSSFSVISNSYWKKISPGFYVNRSCCIYWRWSPQFTVKVVPLQHWQLKMLLAKETEEKKWIDAILSLKKSNKNLLFVLQMMFL